MDRLEKLETDKIVLNEKLSLLAELSRLIKEESVTTSEDERVEESIPAIAGLEDPQLASGLNDLNDQQWQLRRLRRSSTDKTEGVQVRIANLEFTRNKIRRILLQDEKLLRRQLGMLADQSNKLN